MLTKEERFALEAERACRFDPDFDAGTLIDQTGLSKEEKRRIAEGVAEFIAQNPERGCVEGDSMACLLDMVNSSPAVMERERAQLRKELKHLFGVSMNRKRSYICCSEPVQKPWYLSTLSRAIRDDRYVDVGEKEIKPIVLVLWKGKWHLFYGYRQALCFCAVETLRTVKIQGRDPSVGLREEMECRGRELDRLNRILRAEDARQKRQLAHLCEEMYE